jgi:acetyl-CoA carboxylase carboxyl transferase subunit alpha
MAENTQPKPPHQTEGSVPEAWRKTELARHPQRPYPMDYIQALFTDFSEIHGDRQFADDAAMTAGMARFHGEPVLVIGNLKGRSLKERVARKFGSPDPEGYRKALRAMKIAEKFNRPVFTFIDLAGANPGLGAEERGQGEAIARNLLEMSRLRVPTIATITGEGGSGGALALAVADRVLMLENAIYSVISPEGCASILWRKADKAADAAAAMKITAQDLLELKVIDGIIAEPIGGAHRAPLEAIDAAGNTIEEGLRELEQFGPDDLKRLRREKYLQIGQIGRAGVA